MYPPNAGGDEMGGAVKKIGSAVLVCPRVKDLATQRVPSRRASCEKCGELIWRALDSPEEVTEICVQCALVHSGPNLNKVN